jgi:hypothetical protein
MATPIVSHGPHSPHPICNIYYKVGATALTASFLGLLTWWNYIELQSQNAVDQLKQLLERVQHLKNEHHPMKASTCKKKENPEICYNECFKKISALLQTGILEKISPQNHHHLIKELAAAHNKALIYLFIENGLTIDIQDEDGQTIFHKLLDLPSCPHCQMHDLWNWPENVNLNIKDQLGNTALHTLLSQHPPMDSLDAQTHLLKILDQMKRHRTDCALKNQQNQSALDVALYRCDQATDEEIERFGHNPWLEIVDKVKQGKDEL